MIPNEIRAEHVHAAIDEIDRSGVPEERRSKLYSLVYQGRSYPPKYVVSLAAKLATGRELRSNEFNGGSETNSFLRSLGFNVNRSATERLSTDDDLATVIDAWAGLPAGVRAGIVALFQADRELATVIDAWAGLPEAVRVGIVAMVQAASKGRG